MSRTQAWVRASAFIALAIAVGACSAETVTESGTPLARRKIDDNSVTNAARTEGTLVLEGGCIALEEADGTLLTIVWPEPTTECDTELQQATMTRFGDREDVVARISDSVALGGHQTSSTRHFDCAVSPADACPDLLWITG